MRAEFGFLPKYDMTNHPTDDLRNRTFTPSNSVTLTIGRNECPEELGDELRLWCRRKCKAQWKQTVRGIRGIIVMGFESALDAAMFRASALSHCRAVIAANNARRRAQR
ncbi:hypothetical protein [Parerythrobacter lacustris]|uniref:DUF982 domain-containing protein n=1 Tax=Parerythrobacter lacustris TaxID=2969984 RepID=A0ABT1XR30_9SPHN|nr:hypothetical protein [Parerythrobacter lacustris]MCR2834118.1 hypothetical protein [Parerythrobacter lacustris]